MPNPYVIGVLIIAITLALWEVHSIGYTSGADAVTAAYAKSLAEEVKKEQNDVKEIIKWKEKRVIVYRDKIKEINTATDATGCLDANLSDIGLGGMLRPNSDTPVTTDDDAARHSPVD